MFCPGGLQIPITASGMVSHAPKLATGSNLAPQPSNLTCLHSLDLSNNYFHGQIPLEFGHLSLLNVIELPSNNLRVVHFHHSWVISTIPTELGNLHNLSSLQLSENNFSGEFLTSIFNISSLVFLSVTSNNLSGKLTQNSGHDLPNIKNLFLASNRFEGAGDLPSSVANLSGNLQQFCVANNLLTGTIPQGMKKFQNLISLSYENNSFTGELPSEIGAQHNQQQLVIYSNMLSGEISYIFGNFTNLYILAVGDNQFSVEFTQVLDNARD
ncbi:hypothetical protein JHK85_011410 [Glycine max]|nr:hypothetical protein JHK85_011410 [Glycine max]